MIPSNKSMLLCIRRTLTELIPGIESKEQQAALASIDLHLNALLLRTDPTFYRDYYQRGRLLIEDGITLGLADRHVLDVLPPSPLDADIDQSTEALGDLADQVTEVLADISSAAGAPRGGELLDYLNRISDWEISLAQHRLVSAGGQDTQESEAKLTREALQGYLRSKFPEAGDVKVTHLERLYGGFSKATSLFSTDRPIMDCQDFAIRAEQQANILVLDAGTVDVEFPVVSIAFEHGALVPEPLWLELDTAQLGMRFIVFRRALGENFGDATGAGAKLDKATLKSLVKELVAIHEIKPDAQDERVQNSHLAKWTAFDSLQANTLAYVEYWKKLYETAPHSPSALIRRGFDWASANMPDCSGDEVTFLHGDYGLHNLLIHDGKVSAVLDWENSRVGDRAEELSWFFHCTSASASTDELLSLYCEAGGKPVSQERLRFYDVTRCIMMLIVCNVALAKLHQMGNNISLAVIGIQMCETFASKLRALIGEGS